MLLSFDYFILRSFYIGVVSYFFAYYLLFIKDIYNNYYFDFELKRFYIIEGYSFENYFNSIIKIVSKSLKQIDVNYYKTIGQANLNP